MNDMSMPGDDRIAMRSTGIQARSRERVELMLAAAEGLITETGIEGLKMRELARRASLPIASVYHYFPSANAVVWALAVRHLEELRRFLEEKLAGLDLDPAMPLAKRASTASTLVRGVATFLLASPASAVIWDSLRARPDLRALDVEDTIRSAKILKPYLLWAVPGLDPARVGDMTLVFLEAIQANLLAIMRSPTEAQAPLIDTLAMFVSASLRGLQVDER